MVRAPGSDLAHPSSGQIIAVWNSELGFVVMCGPRQSMRRRSLLLGASFPVENPAVEHLGRNVVGGAESPEGEAFGTDEAFGEAGIGGCLGEENPRGVSFDGLNDGCLGAGLFDDGVNLHVELVPGFSIGTKEYFLLQRLHCLPSYL